MRCLVLLAALPLVCAACGSATEDGDDASPSASAAVSHPETQDGFAVQPVVLADRGVVTAPKLLLHPDGQVLVVYGLDVGAGGGPIRMASCSDPSCETVTTVEISPTDRDLQLIDAEIGPQGELCVVAATLAEQPKAVVLSCRDSACGTVAEHTLDLHWPHGMVMADGRAVVAGVSMENGPTIELWLCADATCSEGEHVEIAHPMEKPGAVGFVHDPHALSLTRDELPQYFFTVDGASSYLAACRNASCSSIEEREALHPDLTLSGVLSHVSGPGGAQEVRLLRCADEACTTAQDVLIDSDVAAFVVDHQAMSSSSGLPLVVGRAFWIPLDENRLTIWQCDDSDCATVTRLAADPANHVTAALLPDGQVALAYQSGVAAAEEAEGADLSDRGLSQLSYVRFDPESLTSGS